MLITEYTPEIRAKYAEFLHTHKLVHGVGTADSPCTIAALNIAATGIVTDERPACMSAVIHLWIIQIQDHMPLDMLNSEEWIAAAIDAPGTGNDHEKERISIIMDWMWRVGLQLLQQTADDRGYGDEWRAMCALRTEKAARHASNMAYVDYADNAANAANFAADAALKARGPSPVHAARFAAISAIHAAKSTTNTAAWKTLNPAVLLRKLNAVS